MKVFFAVALMLNAPARALEAAVSDNGNVATVVGPTGEAAGTHAEVVKVIDRELSELEALITLEKQKVELLESMRKHVLAGKSLPDGFEAESPLEAMLARVARPSVNQPKAAWAPESRQEWTQNEAPQRETRGSDMTDLLLARAAMPFNSTIVATCVLPFKTRITATRNSRGAVTSRSSSSDTFLSLVAAVDASGELFILDSERGEVLLALPADVYAPSADSSQRAVEVSHLYFDAGTSANDQPYLALGTSDGRVSLLNVTLWRNDNVIAGKKLKVKKDPETKLPLPNQILPLEPVFRTVEGLGVVVEREFTVYTNDLAILARNKKAAAKKDTASDDGGDDTAAAAVVKDDDENASPHVARVTALCMYQARMQASSSDPGDGTTAQVKMLAVADGSGGIYAIARNGTMARSTKLGRPGDYARDLRRQGASLAVAESGGVSFLSTARFTFAASNFCKGSAVANAVALGFDQLSPAHLYVAYSSGEVILYNTKSKVEGQTMACRKLYKLPHTGANLLSSSEASVEGSEDEEGAALKVIPLRGYALISTPTQGLLLFNTTAVRESAGVTYLGKMEPPSSSAKASCKAGTALLKAAPAAASVPGTAAQKLPEVLIAVASSPACGNDDAETSAFDASGPSQLKILEALLPYDPPKSDVNWMRGPMMIVGLIAVFGYQYFRGGSGGLFRGKRGKGRGRGSSGGMDDEMAELLAGAGGSARAGGGFGGGGRGGLGRNFDPSTFASNGRGNY